MTPPLFSPSPDAAHAGLTPSTSVEQLGEAIATIAARVTAATYELLVLLREFDAREGWNNGCLSCAHWLHWRCSLDLGAAREKVRVARALAELPHLSGAMQRDLLRQSARTHPHRHSYERRATPRCRLSRHRRPRGAAGAGLAAV
jgi:hypothetical protein